MYVRVLTFSGSGDAAQAKQMIEERALPMLRQQQGYRGYLAAGNPGESQAIAIVAWETKEDAERAEEQLGPRREEMVSSLGVSTRSNELLEVQVFDQVETAATA